MLDRRAFILRSIAASAFVACRPAARSVFAGGALESSMVSKALFDENSTYGREFELQAARQGVPARAVAFDVGHAWMHDIVPLWEQGTGAIAGLTTPPLLFCLEIMARDYGMRLVYRARHVPSGGRPRHEITGPPGLSSRWEPLLRAAGSQWASAAASLALTCRQPALPLARLVPQEVCRDSHGDTLFSWLIVPGDVDRALSRRR